MPPRDMLLLAAISLALAGTAAAQASFRPAGLVFLSRHGARTPLFKDPATLAEGNSQLTLEGQNMHFTNGRDLARLYGEGAEGGIRGLSPLYEQEEVYARSSDTDRTINSATSLLLGLFPPNASQSLIMADGTTVYSTPGGYGLQQVPVHIVPEREDLITRGWLNCTKLDSQISAYYASPEYKATEDGARGLLDALSPRFGGRKLGLKDMWNVYDVLNVQKSYDPNFQDLTPEQWKQLTELVNGLEYNKFKSGLGATAFAADVAVQLRGMASASNKKLIHYYSGHYTTFSSAFGLLGLSDAHPELRNIPDYASLLVFELSRSDTGAAFARILYRSGTRGDFKPYALPGLPERVPVDQMAARLEQLGTPDLASWCAACGNVGTRGCGAFVQQQPSCGLSDPAAGAIGAAVALACAGVAAGIAVMVMGRKRKAAAAKGVEVEKVADAKV
ncbi:histidine phosphatase superfamily [Hyaloraphidium curvatum]|nr:histidine phosphatase superfamily [Hyaloraphidium curvatum]